MGGNTDPLRTNYWACPTLEVLERLDMQNEAKRLARAVWQLFERGPRHVWTIRLVVSVTLFAFSGVGETVG